MKSYVEIHFYKRDLSFCFSKILARFIRIKNFFNEINNDKERATLIEVEESQLDVKQLKLEKLLGEKDFH